jgi:putative DNA primase/helicase
MIQTTRNQDTDNPVLQAALQYLSLGFVVIPIMKNAKRPPFGFEWKRYQKERPTEDKVREWFPEGSEANLAIVTGSASGVTVIDIDVGHDPWPPEGCQLPNGCIIATPSGGRHCYVTHIPGVTTSANGLPKGIHVRGDGGIAVAPPSIIDGNPYTVEEGSLEEARRTEAPVWLQDALRAPQRKNESHPLSNGIPRGARNTTLTSLAGSMRHRGMIEEAIRSALLIENERRCEPPLTEDEVASIAKSIGKKKPSIDSAPEPELSDGSNARRFVAVHGENLHYCPSDKSWYVWTETLWERDKTLEVEKLAQKFIRQQYARASEIEDDEKRSKWTKHVIKWDSRKGIDSTIHLARSLDGVPVRLEELDGNDMVLNTQSCTIDFDQKEIEVLRRNHSPTDLITKICPTVYDPSARSPLWDDFLKTATNGDRELELFLQRSAGYCLIGTNPEEKFFFIYGPTASGKSTFIEAIKAALGDYAVSINAATFLEQRYSGGAQPEVVKIKAARIVIASETEPGKKFNADLIKALAGRDTIACRDLYSKPIQFKFEGKLWLISNFAPGVSIEDEAFMRRMVVIRFDHTIPEADRKPEVKTILTDPNISGAAILNWMVEGYLNYRDIGLSIPDSVRESTQRYKEEINPIADFIEERCIIEPGDGELTISSATLFDAYMQWANTNKMKHPVKKKKFGICLREYGLEPERCSVEGKRARTWTGIKLIG